MSNGIYIIFGLCHVHFDCDAEMSIQLYFTYKGSICECVWCLIVIIICLSTLPSTESFGMISPQFIFAHIIVFVYAHCNSRRLINCVTIAFCPLNHSIRPIYIVRQAVGNLGGSRGGCDHGKIINSMRLGGNHVPNTLVRFITLTRKWLANRTMCSEISPKKRFANTLYTRCRARVSCRKGTNFNWIKFFFVVFTFNIA